ATEERLAALQARYEKELALVNQIREVRGKLEEAHAAGAHGSADAGKLRTELNKLNGDLEAMQGESPLIRVCVDQHIVGEVVSGWTGIPIGKMVRDEITTIVQLEKHLGSRVISQDHGLEVISQRIRTSKASLEDPN